MNKQSILKIVTPGSLQQVVSRADAAVCTELVTFENQEGLRLVGFHDYVSTDSPPAGWMLVLPGYGETKTDVLAEAYFLAKNGFHTLRFDFSDHVGESDGDILKTSLTKFTSDIHSATNYLFERFGPVKLGAVARSLASRALIRAAREDRRIRLIINLVCIVDVRKTLCMIYREDHFAHFHRGYRSGVMDVLGFQVDSDNFLQSASEDNFENLNDTLDDVRHLAVPTIFFAAEQDVWVELKDVRHVFDEVASGDKELYVLKNVMHTIHENPQLAQQVLRHVTACSVKYLTNTEAYSLIKPQAREIGLRIKREKERNKLVHSVSKEEEREFWKTYLDKYSFVINVHDYWNLLELIYRLLGEPKSGEKLLDAGCGLGHFGLFLLLKSFYGLQHAPLLNVPQPVYNYVGVDFVREGILGALSSQYAIEEKFVQNFTFSMKQKTFSAAFCVGDLDQGMPFKDGSFEKICSNLVVSYLQSPSVAVDEMVRVLKPQGRIVLTSLKPFADLSEVYRNFVKVTASKEAIGEAQKLLSNAGRIKLKEAKGIYEFFSEEALAEMLKDAGVRDVETFRSFGNQANLAIGTKM
jgi:ubiquinone/menaquinone biosynthesis C-methylase UbiE